MRLCTSRDRWPEPPARPARRRIRRTRSLWLPLLVARALAGCTEAPKPSPLEPAEVGESPLELAAKLERDREERASRAAGEALAGFRNSSLPLPPAEHPTSNIAWGPHVLVLLSGSSMRLFDTEDWGRVTEVPLAAPRHATVLADGNVLVAARDATFVFNTKGEPVGNASRIPSFPGTVLFGDPRDANQTWSVHPFEATLFEHRWRGDSSRDVGMGSTVALRDWDHRGFVPLPDGAFAFTTRSGLCRSFPEGQPKCFEDLSPAETWRLSRASRIDCLHRWTTHEGTWMQVAPDMRVLGSYELPDGVVDASSGGDTLAFVVSREKDGQRAFQLVTTSEQGEHIFTTDLPLDALPPADDWVQTLTRNQRVTVSPGGTLVAVGGPSRLRVWRVPAGELVASWPNTTSDPP